MIYRCNTMFTGDKKSFELLLENTPHIQKPDRRLEQYETPPVIAAHMLWQALLRGDLEGRDVADLGCGSLRLGLGAYFLGANRVLAIDIDEEQLMLNEEYLYEKKITRITQIHGDVREISLRNIDTIVMNPPFGVYPPNRGIDLFFLRKALEIGGTAVYTIHKYSPRLDALVETLASGHGFRIVWREILDFPIPALFETHRRKIYRVKTVFYILKRRTGEER